MKIHNDNLSVTPDQLMLQKLLIASRNGTTIKKLVVQSIQQRSVKPAQSAPVPAALSPIEETPTPTTPKLE
jgi:hypothetical protein